MSAPFSHEYRLHYRWEFLKFFHKAEVIRLPECLVFRIPNQLTHFRLGVTMKAKGSSVDRNKVKRQVRESFRTLGRELGSFDYNVVIPKQKKLGYPYPQRLKDCLREDFPRQLARAKKQR